MLLEIVFMDCVFYFFRSHQKVSKTWVRNSLDASQWSIHANTVKTVSNTV